MLVNVVGAFVLGLVTGLGLDADAVALFGTGFCGALTTYSAFALESALLGFSAIGIAYVAVTIAGCLIAAVLGMKIGAALVA